MQPSTRTTVFLFLLVFASAGCALESSHRVRTAPVPTRPEFAVQPGDLLFQDLDGSPLCDAIEKVTDGYDRCQLSHVGMATVDDAGQVLVIEAISKGVVLTPLNEFLARSHDAQGLPKVLVGRVNPAYRHLIGPAVAYALQQRGKPYDRQFVMRGDAYYCSELIYDAFRYAGGGTPLFEAAPMTFKDPATDDYFPAWVEYYAELGMAIPQGEPGVNPGGISRSPCLSIVHFMGQPGRKQ